MKALTYLIFLSLMICTGCGTIGRILPGNDPIVVNGERTIKIAFETFDTFLKLEYDNRENLKKISPEIFNVAEKIRYQGPRWLDTAKTTLRAYKQNRTEENKFGAITALAVLQNGLTEAEKYIALSNSTPQ